MMYEGKHIHFSPVDNRPLCSYSAKLCRQRRVNGYAFCIRHILEDKTAPFKQCAHVAKYNNQKCTNPIPSNENREFCNSHMQVAGMAPKKERKYKKEKGEGNAFDGKVKFAERVKVLLKGEGEMSPENFDCLDDPYAFSDATLDFSEARKLPSVPQNVVALSSTNRLATAATAPSAPDYGREALTESGIKVESPKTNCVTDRSKGSNNSNNNNNGGPGSNVAGNPTRCSKSVNRLEARIARNKILDKLKKSRPHGAASSDRCSGAKLGFGSHEHCTVEGRVVGPSVALTSAASPVIGHRLVDSGSTQQHNYQQPSSCYHRHHNPSTTSLSPSQTTLSGDGCPDCALLSASSSSPSPFAFASTSVRGAVPGTDNGSLAGDPHLPATRQPTVRSILPRSRVKSRTWKRPDRVSDAVKALQRIWDEKKEFQSDLFPLGFETLESESGDNETDIYQRHWFSSPSDDPWVDDQHALLLRPMKLDLERAELRRQCVQLNKAQVACRSSKQRECALAQALVASSRSQPLHTARLLTDFNSKHGFQHTKRKTEKNWVLGKQKCCYSNEDTECRMTALPYTRHCIKRYRSTSKH